SWLTIQTEELECEKGSGHRHSQYRRHAWLFRPPRIRSLSRTAESDVHLVSQHRKHTDDAQSDQCNPPVPLARGEPDSHRQERHQQYGYHYIQFIHFQFLPVKMVCLGRAEPLVSITTRSIA